MTRICEPAGSPSELDHGAGQRPAYSSDRLDLVEDQLPKPVNIVRLDPNDQVVGASKHMYDAHPGDLDQLARNSGRFADFGFDQNVGLSQFRLPFLETYPSKRRRGEGRPSNSVEHHGCRGRWGAPALFVPEVGLEPTRP